jgi:two-component sensor histidine kinase
MAEASSGETMAEFSDITMDADSDREECRRLRAQIETMNQEMRHRLRNAYAVSAAVASASGREEPEHREFAEGLAQRFNSLSLAQSMLLETGARHTLSELVRRIVESFDPERQRLSVGELCDRDLGEQQVRLAALVLGELATNSIKHGALKHGRPVRLDAVERDQALVVTWTEDLGRAAGQPGANGQAGGLALMARMARAHGGTFHTEWEPERLVACLNVPITA